MSERITILIEQLQQRAVDPHRRIDAVPTIFDQTVSTLDLGGLGLAIQGIAGDLARTLASIREGRIDHEMARRAETVRQQMSTPAAEPAPPPASVAQVEGAEARFGFALPDILRRFYLEVADGGVGPDSGLLPISAVADTYLELLSEPQGELEEPWPQGVIPLVAYDGGWDCLDAGSGRIVGVEFDEIEQDDGEVAWGLTTEQRAPSPEDWLSAWLEAAPPPSPAEVFSSASLVDEARRARARIAGMTLEERRAMGLPDEGWERVVCGGLGLDE